MCPIKNVTLWKGLLHLTSGSETGEGVVKVKVFARVQGLVPYSLGYRFTPTLLVIQLWELWHWMTKLVVCFCSKSSQSCEKGARFFIRCFNFQFIWSAAYFHGSSASHSMFYPLVYHSNLFVVHEHCSINCKLALRTMPMMVYFHVLSKGKQLLTPINKPLRLRRSQP